MQRVREAPIVIPTSRACRNPSGAGKEGGRHPLRQVALAAEGESFFELIGGVLEGFASFTADVRGDTGDHAAGGIGCLLEAGEIEIKKTTKAGAGHDAQHNVHRELIRVGDVCETFVEIEINMLDAGRAAASVVFEGDGADADGELVNLERHLFGFRFGF